MNKEIKAIINDTNDRKLELLKKELKIENDSSLINFLIDSFYMVPGTEIGNVTMIDKEYLTYLEKQDNQLTYLEIKGVDNWGECSKYQFDEEYCEENDLEYEG